MAYNSWLHFNIVLAHIKLIVFLADGLVSGNLWIGLLAMIYI